MTLADMFMELDMKEEEINGINESILEAGTQKEVKYLTMGIRNKYHLPGEFIKKVTSYVTMYKGDLSTLKQDVISRMSPYLDKYIKVEE